MEEKVVLDIQNNWFFSLDLRYIEYGLRLGSFKTNDLTGETVGESILLSSTLEVCSV